MKDLAVGRIERVEDADYERDEAQVRLQLLHGGQLKHWAAVSRVQHEIAELKLVAYIIGDCKYLLSSMEFIHNQMFTRVVREVIETGLRV